MPNRRVPPTPLPSTPVISTSRANKEEEQEPNIDLSNIGLSPGGSSFGNVGTEQDEDEEETQVTLTYQESGDVGAPIIDVVNNEQESENNEFSAVQTQAAATAAAGIQPAQSEVIERVEETFRFAADNFWGPEIKAKFRAAIDEYERLREERQNVEYGLEVIAPQPEPGYNTAIVKVITDCGISNTKSFTYLDACVPTPPPPKNDSLYVELDIRNAYVDCLSTIEDLFCPPSSSFPEFNFLEVIPDYSRLSVVNGKIMSDSIIDVSYAIKGAGSYEISFLVGEQQLYSTGFLEIDTAEESLIVRAEEEISIPEEGTLTIRFTHRNTDGEPLPRIEKTYEIFSDPPGVSGPVFGLVSDNDQSDSQKELYITISSSVSITKDIGNIQEENLLPTDPLRNAYKSFWILDSSREKYVYNATRREELPVITTSKMRKTSTENYFLETVMYDYNSPLETDGFVFDMAYDHLKPYTKKEYNSAERPFSSKILDVEKEYNFYYRDYEEVQKQFASGRENLLPNMYYLQLKDQVSKNLGTAITSEQELSLDPDIENLISLSDTSELASSINNDYYEYFIEKYRTSTIEEETDLIERSKNILISRQFLDKMDEFSNKKEIFPMFVDIKVDTDGAKSVSRLIKDSKFGNWFFYNLVDTFSRNTQKDLIENFLKQQQGEDGAYFKQRLRTVKLKDTLDSTAQPIDNFVYLGNYKDFQALSSTGGDLELDRTKFKNEILNLIENKGRKYNDILAGKKSYKETLFYRIAKYSGEPTETSKPIQNIWVINDPDKQSIRYVDTQVVYEAGYTYRIYSYDFVIGNDYKMEVISGGGSVDGLPVDDDVDRTRTLENSGIYSVKASPSIAPVAINPGTIIPEREIQRVPGAPPLFSNPSPTVGSVREKTRDTISNIVPDISLTRGAVDEIIRNVRLDTDSQNLQSEVQNSVAARTIIRIKNILDTRIVENIYDEFEAKVIDKPPTPPQAQLKSYVGIDNKIIILLDKNVSTNEQNSIIITQQDEQIFERVRQQQELEPWEPIKFSGDDLIKKYQIFRLSKAPKTYRDFANARLIEKDTLLDGDEEKRVNAASFIDTIVPNQRYYYTFRCVDIHDQLSNPGEIYQVEMVNEGGTIYPKIEIYELSKDRDFDRTKDLKRFIMIKPNALQSYMDIETEDLESHNDLLRQGITIGVKENSIMNKQYKMRIVSKNSNKVYDLNFSFGKTVKIVE